MLLASFPLLASCISMDVPNEIQYTEVVSLYSFNCEEPYALSIGCGDKGFLSTIPLKIGQRLVMVSSTQDGAVLVITNRYRREIVDLPDFLTLGIVDTSAIHLGQAVIDLENQLAERNIQIEDIKVVSNVFDVWAYVVVTDGDALSALGIRPAT